MIVYLIRCSATGKGYIGRTSLHYLSSRWAKHVYKARHDDANSPITRAIQRYGISAFTRSVLARTKSARQADLLEKRFIEQLKTMAPRGYNLTTGGTHCRRHPSTGRKISATKMGHDVSTETRQNMRAARIGNPRCRGWKLSKKTKDKIRRARIAYWGRIHAGGAIRKVRES